MIQCPNCDDTGCVCDSCGQPDGQCCCAGGPFLTSCHECAGWDEEDTDDDDDD